MPLSNLATIAMQRGDYKRAAGLLDESIRLYHSVGYEQKLAVVLGNRGGLAFRQGKYEEAATIHKEALSRKRSIGDRLSVAHSLGDLAVTEIERGHNEPAGRLLMEALGIFSEAGQMDGMVEALEALARIAQDRNDLHRAAHLYAGAATLRSEIGVTHHPADQRRHEAALDSLRDALGVDAFEAAWGIGQAKSLSQLLEEAAAVEDRPLETATGSEPKAHLLSLTLTETRRSRRRFART